MGKLLSRPPVSLRGLQSGVLRVRVCVSERERREKKGTIKNDSLDNVHTNADAFEIHPFFLYFELISVLSWHFPLLKAKLSN